MRPDAGALPSGVAAVSPAPSVPASARLAGWRVRSIVSAPASCASCSASRPITPPPMTRTRSPARGAPMSRPCSVQASGSQKAPCSGSRSAGRVTRLARREDRVLGEAAVAVDAGGDVALAEVDPAAAAGVAAAAPVVGVAGDARARRRASTPSPRRSTMPANSWPSVTGGVARELALEEMAVGAADAGRFDPDQHLAGTRRRHRHLHGTDIVRGQELCRAHQLFRPCPCPAAGRWPRLASRCRPR